MVNALSDVDGSILDCKKSIEGFDNSILGLHTEIFERIQKQFSDLGSEISNLVDLFDDLEVSDEKGTWSKEAIAQMGLLAQQYELAEYQVQQYDNEINELNARYLAGKYSATEYADRLSELSSAQWDAVKASESAKDAIMELNEARVENQIKGIENEIDAYDELIQAQIDALKASKDLHDYEQSIAEKTKSVTGLERQIAAMRNDTSAATVAKRKKLEEQLAEARKDLGEAEYDHSIETQENALNKQSEDHEKERNNEIDALRESLNDKEALLSGSFEAVKANASTVGQEIAAIAAEHGVTVSNALISSWQSGEDAIASYGTALSWGSSAFIQNIMGVENEAWNLQAQADNTADALAWMFSTKADALVGELEASYLAGADLASMTEALHQSLIATLEGGYDVSGIVSALDSIAGAAENARTAIDSLNVPVSGGNQLSHDTGKISHTVRLQQYAGGTRSTEGNVIVTDEEGHELKLPRLSSGQYTIANEGSQVLTKEQTDNMYEWAKIDPTKLIPVDLTENLWKNAGVSPMVNRTVNAPITIHYDSMLTVNGDVNDTNHFIKQVEAIADKSAARAADMSMRRLSDGIRW